MPNDVINLSMILIDSLYVQCPRLSGNMANHIRVVETDADEVTIEISAPQYDLAKWEKEGVILFTGDLPEYAVAVNEHGHFGSEDHCKYWVNDTCYDICKLYAQSKHNGSRVRCYLPLFLGGM